ncbi:MAG TPA: enoyl-CoA hydratase/isomerase family protein [Bryobacteraceae bacterium]|nr:enoyl-CoA hydratase/isomerase family protein [Bryobacteraceae bacterium]
MPDSPLLSADRSASYALLSVEREPAVIWVTLNRPEARNTLKCPQTFLEFKKVFDEIEADASIKALVITGAGERDFCMGSDLSLLEDSFRSRNFSVFRDYLDQINSLFFALEELPVPTIAMVQGQARAGGFELILACDFVMMASEAVIGDVHTPYGHIPGGGGTQRLARKVGIQKAMDIILTGRWISAEEATRIGLALQTAPRLGLRAATAGFAAQFADKSRGSLKFSKSALLRGWDLPLRDGIQLEIQSYIEYLATSEEPVEIFWKNQRIRRAKKGASDEQSGNPNEHFAAHHSDPA